MNAPTARSEHSWWPELRHGGILISRPVLQEAFPVGALESRWYAYQRLRDRFLSFQAWRAKLPADGDRDQPTEAAASPATTHQPPATPLHAWLDAVLEDFLGHPAARWQKGPHVADKWAADLPLIGPTKPNRVLFLDDAREHAALIVMVDRSARVGLGRGREAYSRLAQMLRAPGFPKLGLLTNGQQFRIVYAGLDHDAWAEFEIGDWFEEGIGREQLDGFFTLLGARDGAGLHAAPPAAEAARFTYPLLQAVEASRSKQGDLASVLGEQVREAVEKLLDPVDRTLRKHADFLDPLRKTPDGAELPQREVLAALYQAASRVVMRMVVAFFAEARGLLPRSLEGYNASYGLEGLFEQLQKARNAEGFLALDEPMRTSAWPRLLALFRLIHDGSPFADAPVRPYGGMLFRPGDPASPDPVLRALSLFESDRMEVTDARVLEVLQRLKIGQVKIKRARQNAWVAAPVDFADLRTEYIGIIYEGLLDYELKMTPEVQVFLNLGQQPVLPLSILENMPPKNLKDLLDKLGKGESSTTEDTEKESEGTEEAVPADGDTVSAPNLDAGEGAAPSESIESTLSIGSSVVDEAVPSVAEQARQRAYVWAEKAVEIAGLVKKPSGKKANRYEYDKDRKAAALRLVVRVLDQGELYLVRWGGTRKGSGTFYTKPQLAVPTVHRTLEPLVYEPATSDKAPKSPKQPEAILSLKICDPACGSGSFLVAALLYLTRALWESLHVHGRIRQQGKETLITLPLGEAAAGKVEEDVLPVPPDDERFEPMLKARLMRYVVERCLYGVDLNPLAVELCKLSLWVETLDPDLPMTFLDHKIRCGNSLVGCWFDRFEDYPALAWEREGGDKQHSNGVRFAKGQLTAAIQKTKDERVRGELAELIAKRAGAWLFTDAKQDARQVHDKAREKLEELHALSVLETDERERRYRKLRDSREFVALKEAFDAWCAVWFWPPTAVADDGGLTPARWHDLISHGGHREHGDQIQKDREAVARLAREHRFFHWELEFPDVFTVERQGFDAIVGNPPWEILKPNSKEFFSNLDPVYRTYGKQEALSHQNGLFTSDPDIERLWVEYNAQFKALGAFAGNAALPFGDPQEGAGSFTLAEGKSGRARSLELHTSWREERAGRGGYADREHPFRHQGSADLNTYKMFLEAAHALLRAGGRLGMIVPSGLYTDKGTQDLRKLFLERCHWEWLFGFENRRKIFVAVDERSKFCPIIVEKSGKTEAIQTAFMRHDLSDWEHAGDFGAPYLVGRVKTYSPRSGALLEICSGRDAAILDRMYATGILIGDQQADGWEFDYGRELEMTSDSGKFPPLPAWEAKGFRPDPYGRWLGPGEDCAYPLYEGRMIDQFDFSASRWVSGKGRSATWVPIPFSAKEISPQFLLGLAEYRKSAQVRHDFKLAMMRISSATNERTMIAAAVPAYAAQHSLFTGTSSASALSTVELVAILNAFCFDFLIRQRCGGNNVTAEVINESVIPRFARLPATLLLHSSALSIPHVVFSAQWLQLRLIAALQGRCRAHWAITAHERLRLRCILDAIVAELYGLSFDDFAWILRQDMSDPKGFWRVDQDKPLELRHTTLALAGFRDLKGMGLDAFCALNGSEGWMIPNEVADPAQWALGDQGIIQLPKNLTQPESADPAAQTPATDRLGPRFLPWQLEGTPEDSWKECELHARNILGDEAFKRLMAGEDPYAPDSDGKGRAPEGDDFQSMPDSGKKSTARGKQKKGAKGQQHMF
ncbi:MAG: hypothetical protein ABSE73_01155 [Planctomycetota bacterium]